MYSDEMIELILDCLKNPKTKGAIINHLAENGYRVKNQTLDYLLRKLKKEQKIIILKDLTWKISMSLYLNVDYIRPFTPNIILSDSN